MLHKPAKPDCISTHFSVHHHEMIVMGTSRTGPLRLENWQCICYGFFFFSFDIATFSQLVFKQDEDFGK